MSSRKRIIGRIELYSLSLEFVTSKPYESKKHRNEIVEAWRRKYPHQSFYVIIKPEYDDKD